MKCGYAKGADIGSNFSLSTVILVFFFSSWGLEPRRASVYRFKLVSMNFTRPVPGVPE